MPEKLNSPTFYLNVDNSQIFTANKNIGKKKNQCRVKMNANRLRPTNE